MENASCVVIQNNLNSRKLIFKLTKEELQTQILKARPTHLNPVSVAILQIPNYQEKSSYLSQKEIDFRERLIERAITDELYYSSCYAYFGEGTFGIIISHFPHNENHKNIKNFAKKFNLQFSVHTAPVKEQAKLLNLCYEDIIKQQPKINLIKLIMTPEKSADDLLNILCFYHSLWQEKITNHIYIAQEIGKALKFPQNKLDDIKTIIILGNFALINLPTSLATGKTPLTLDQIEIIENCQKKALKTCQSYQLKTEDIAVFSAYLEEKSTLKEVIEISEEYLELYYLMLKNAPIDQPILQISEKFHGKYSAEIIASLWQVVDKSDKSLSALQLLYR